MPADGLAVHLERHLSAREFCLGNVLPYATMIECGALCSDIVSECGQRVCSLGIVAGSINIVSLETVRF